MKMYDESNLEEWSRKLRAKHGNNFRLYSTEKETLERWAYHLSSIYNITPAIKDSAYETLESWSKLIGG